MSAGFLFEHDTELDSLAVALDFEREHVPDLRVRTAGSVRLRHAVGLGSFGLDYRYYLDTWGLRSQTIEPALTWLPSASASMRHCEALGLPGSSNRLRSQ